MTGDVLLGYREKFVYYYTSVGFIALIVLGVIPHLSTGNYKTALFEGIIALSLLSNTCFYKRHRNYSLLSNMAHLLVMIVFLYLVVSGGYKGTGIFWSFSYPLLSFFLKSSKEAIFWNLAFVTSVGILYVLRPEIFYYDLVTLRQALGAYIVIFILSFIYNGAIVGLLNVMKEKATFDALTGLYSRDFFMETLEKVLRQAERHTTGEHVLVYIDLDNFKNVNDYHGHAVGDKILREVAFLMSSFFRGGDIVGRIGGDEFMVLAPNATKDGLEGRLKKLKELIENKFRKYGISISYGIVSIPKDGVDLGKLIKKADRLMYEMKNSS